MPVEYTKDAVVKAEKNYWRPTRIAFEGQASVKAATTDFLPAPQCADGEPDSARYKAYLTRAIYYNVTGRTARGMVGLVFNKEPQKELPSAMTPLLHNVDGEGVTLVDQSADALRGILLYGRSGLYVNYPAGTATQADVNSGRVRPTIHLYNPWDIINWRTAGDGSRTYTSLVVLKEEYFEDDKDGFMEVKKVRYRELRMVRLDGKLVFRINLWDVDEGGRVATQPRTFYPTNAKGEYWDHIPFYPIGSDTNNWDIDPGPLYDLATVNLGHFRNSADYEESVYTVGQPTYIVSGLTQTWVDKNMNGKFVVGSRALIPLPANASGDILQPDPNTMAKEAMEMKQQQMVALGAKLIEQRSVARTATESSNDVVVDNSILAVCARNVNAAYRLALLDAAAYQGVTLVEGEHFYELNTDYDTRRMTAQERLQLIEEWVSGAITFEEMRYNMKRSGIAYEDDEKAKTTIKTELDMRKPALESRGKTGPDPEPKQPTPGDTGS